MKAISIKKKKKTISHNCGFILYVCVTIMWVSNCKIYSKMEIIKVYSPSQWNH